MLLTYDRPRKHHIRGPYTYCKDGNVVSIPLRGGPVEVPDEIGHKIISEAGDIIKVVQAVAEKPPAKKATGKRRVSRRKDVKSYVTKEA